MKNKSILQTEVYPLFDEVENIIKNIEYEFNDLIFDNQILSKEQEDKVFDILNKSDFGIKKNTNDLKQLSEKLDTVLKNKRINQSIQSKIIYNQNNILNYQTKMEMLTKIKTKLSNKTKEEKTTDKSLALNEGSTIISKIGDDKKKRENFSYEQKAEYIDNIGDTEKTHLHFHDYDLETNQKVRISLNVMIDRIKNKTTILQKNTKNIDNCLKDDKFMAYNQNILKFRLIDQNNELTDEFIWCNKILNDLKTANNLSNLDLQVKENLENLVHIINNEKDNLTNYAKSLDEKLLNNKDKYNQILKDDIKQELSDFYIDKVNHNKEDNNLSYLYEKYIKINNKIQQIQGDSEVKKEYTTKLKELNTLIKDKLKEESENQKNSSKETIDVSTLKINNFYTLTENDKKKISKNPVATAKLFDALTSGEIKTAKGVKKLKDEEKSHISSILNDVYMYRLQEQGLVDINVKENNNEKIIEVVGKSNKDELSRLSTYSLSISTVLPGKNKNKVDENNLEIEL